jgi:MFS family permease
VLVALTAQFVLIGALDFLYVIIADEALGLGTSGAGWLAALFGVGAVAGGLLSVRLIGRPRLAPLTLIPLLVFAIALAALASWTLLAVAVVALPALGLGRSLIDLSGRMLLQRSAPAGALASIFAVIEILSGLGLIIGSLLAQVLVAVDGTGTALFVLAVAFSLVAAALWRPLRHVDDSADVPVVAIRLLHRIPLFTPLSPPSLEGVARSAIEREVASGTVLIREGDLGDTYFAIVDGAVEVQVAGRTIRRLQRGEGFGEVALLADVPRTATVISVEPTTLLAVDRVPFMVAVTGSDTSERVAWSMIDGLELGTYRARIEERRSNERPEPPVAPPPT